jgi:hypothetical protein
MDVDTEPTLDELLDWADLIAQRCTRGDVPAQDSSGRYVFSDRDLDLKALASVPSKEK